MSEKKRPKTKCPKEIQVVRGLERLVRRATSRSGMVPSIASSLVVHGRKGGWRCVAGLGRDGAFGMAARQPDLAY